MYILYMECMHNVYNMFLFMFICIIYIYILYICMCLYIPDLWRINSAHLILAWFLFVSSFGRQEDTKDQPWGFARASWCLLFLVQGTTERVAPPYCK